MKITKPFYALVFAGACATSAYGQYTLTFNIQEVGIDVVVSASGAVNLSNWGSLGSSYSHSSGFLNPSTGLAVVGAGQLWYYPEPSLGSPNPIMGPGSSRASTSFTGDVVGVTVNISGDSELYIKQNYVSGSALSGTATYANTTLSLLGFNPTSSSYTYTKGTDTIVFNIGSVPPPVPEASGSVAGIGLALAGWYQLRRRKAAVGKFRVES
ncbi:MAG: hypothetical protein ACO3I0_08225 [Limisphaerales bacterium]